MSKQSVRREALRVRRSMPKEQNLTLSAMVQQRLEALGEYSKARVLACYVAKDDEVQTRGIMESAIESGKSVIAPRTDPSTGRLTFHQVRSVAELRPGYFGVLEPASELPEVSLTKAKLVLVPVVAWDVKGGRLGYGKGYFDRELRHRGDALAVGLAFESQRQENIPVTRLDSPLDLVVTERRVVRCRGDADA